MSQTVTRLRDLTKQQKRSGLAAWLGWLFDGLDMHLYTLVAMPFVAALLMTDTNDPEVKVKSSIIQALFLVGWALGGAFFGRVGDLLGRRKALVLTILTYACFTGLSALAQTWWQLGICRFLAALGIGGEWAVGASLLVETWPKKWRPWIAAVLQSAVNCGIMLACLAGFILKEDESNRLIFLVGILPALITLWIRKAVPETEEWEAAQHKVKPPGVMELFSPKVRGVTWRVLLICAVSLTAHWAFMFWQQAHVRALPEFANVTAAEKNSVAVTSLFWVMVGSVIGNFVAGGLAKLLGYRKAIVLMLAGYAAAMWGCFHTTWSYEATLWWFAVIGLCQGVFGLFTMCLPPLFPTLLRTTGAGFCYNFGRIVAAAGTVYFGLAATGKVDDYRLALLNAGYLFIPAAIVAILLPLEKDQDDQVNLPAD
ncbi:MFS transporter [Verrucomicrobium sp. BvORR106]|uniref:MFS transporter n=1 Tax=Verrucomicrobium sp. BvORR106 TaxID=1403819 RepID=UPI00056F83BA|nr:MFS transporter [Verrucomicrobium sp. BvORR106]